MGNVVRPINVHGDIGDDNVRDVLRNGNSTLSESTLGGEDLEQNKRLKISHGDSEGDALFLRDENVAVNESMVSQPLATRGRITRFAQSRYRMFETRDPYTSFSEYGRSLEDFGFHDLISATRCSWCLDVRIRIIVDMMSFI